jgi:hypothetical protein
LVLVIDVVAVRLTVRLLVDPDVIVPYMELLLELVPSVPVHSLPQDSRERQVSRLEPGRVYVRDVVCNQFCVRSRELKSLLHHSE